MDNSGAAGGGLSNRRSGTKKNKAAKAYRQTPRRTILNLKHQNLDYNYTGRGPSPYSLSAATGEERGGASRPKNWRAGEETG
jgi:hypothetical protein